MSKVTKMVDLDRSCKRIGWNGQDSLNVIKSFPYEMGDIVFSISLSSLTIISGDETSSCDFGTIFNAYTYIYIIFTRIILCVNFIFCG